MLSDLTGGFNYGSAPVELAVPGRIRGRADRRPAAALAALPDRPRPPASAAGRRLHARARDLPDHRGAGRRAAPRRALGGRDRGAARHEQRAPRHTFALRYPPVLALRRARRSRSRRPAGDWEPWEELDSFADSAPDDRHFTIDLVAGVIALGPELHDPTAASTQRGAIAPKGAALRMSRYRHGGGRIGNVAAGTLTTLRSAIPGVASVTNPAPARGGVDPQSAQEARTRAAARDPHPPPRGDRARTTSSSPTDASPPVARAVRVRRRRARRHAGHTAPGRPRRPALTIEELTPDAELLDEVGAPPGCAQGSRVARAARPGAPARRVRGAQPRRPPRAPTPNRSSGEWATRSTPI